MPDLSVQHVEQGRLRLVYPLIRSATRVTLSQWESFASELVGAGGGVIAAVSPDQCIHGVAAYRPRTSLRHRRSLDVEVFAAFDLRRSDHVRELLCAALQRLARENDCLTVKITVAPRNADHGSRGRNGMERLGLKLDTAAFVAELRPGAAARPGNKLRAGRRRLSPPAR